MRINIQLSTTEQSVPFNYQHDIIRRLHRWLGQNNPWHETLSLYSVGGLQGGRGMAQKKSIDFSQEGPCLNIGAWEADLMHAVMDGLYEEPDFIYGMRIEKINLLPPPRHMSAPRRFMLDSPVLLKKKRADGSMEFVTYKNPKEAERLLTSATVHKMDKAGLDAMHKSIRIYFDPEFQNPKTKNIHIKGIQNIASMCPIIAEGTDYALKFLWLTGAGSGTGAGFGALQ